MSSDLDVPAVPSVSLAMPDLQRQLADSGNSLFHPPASNEELFAQLENLEDLLSKVKQESDTSARESLQPAINALIANRLLRHTDADVKIAVASCINEITRITAPDAPYGDDNLKEFFQLVLLALRRLCCPNNRCYSKAVSILFSLGKYRSCVSMLDLGMDALIVEMFQELLVSIQCNPCNILFSYMEQVMTVIIDEYDFDEFVPLDLFRILLSSVKNNNKEVSPVSWMLGVRVLTKCATKVRPYLGRALTSTGTSIRDYAGIVASICQDATQGENMEVKELVSDIDYSTEVDRLGYGTSKAVDNISIAQDLNHDIPGKQNTLKTSKLGHQERQSQSNDVATSERDDNHLMLENYLRDQNTGAIQVQKAVDLATIPQATGVVVTKAVPQEQSYGVTVPRKRERKRNTFFKPEEGYEHSLVIDKSGQKRRRKTIIPEDAAKEMAIKAVASCSTAKPLRHESHRGKASKSQDKRKPSSSVIEFSLRSLVIKVKGARLVGLEVRVWWPEDEKFYEGIIASFDHSTKRHKVIYYDGDVETLDLMNEHWQLTKDDCLNYCLGLETVDPIFTLSHSDVLASIFQNSVKKPKKLVMVGV